MLPTLSPLSHLAAKIPRGHGGRPRNPNQSEVVQKAFCHLDRGKAQASIAIKLLKNPTTLFPEAFDPSKDTISTSPYLLGAHITLIPKEGKDHSLIGPYLY